MLVSPSSGRSEVPALLCLILKPLPAENWRPGQRAPGARQDGGCCWALVFLCWLWFRACPPPPTFPQPLHPAAGWTLPCRCRKVRLCVNSLPRTCHAVCPRRAQYHMHLRLWGTQRGLSWEGGPWLLQHMSRLGNLQGPVAKKEPPAPRMS